MDRVQSRAAITRRRRWDGIWEVVVSRGWRRRLRAVLSGLSADSRAWLVLDPMTHLAWVRWPRLAPGVAVFAPRRPEEMIAAVDLAVSAGVGGIVVVDVDGLRGLWGLVGPDIVLWLPLAAGRCGPRHAGPAV